MEFSIGTFEGPLDLLLALVRKEEMDIVDIDIHLITQKYLTIIQENSSLELSENGKLNEGGEFIQMASTLMYLKSRSLLPIQEEKELEEEEILSKEDLIQALLSRDQYLKVAEKLNQRPRLNKDFWTCVNLEFIPPESGEIETEGLFSLVQAFRKTMKRATSFKMIISFPSISEWILKMKTFLIKGQKCSFQDLVQRQFRKQQNQQPYVHQFLLSFLSILELGKIGVVTLKQKDENIWVHTHQNIDSSIYRSLKIQGENLHEKVG